MRIVLDSCMSPLARDQLTAAGHDVVYVGDWPRDPGDEEILAHAAAEGRVVVTIDKDFGELAVAQGKPHAGIIRLVNIRVKQQAKTCLDILNRYEAELQQGALITAEPGYVRIRPAERDD